MTILGNDPRNQPPGSAPDPDSDSGADAAVDDGPGGSADGKREQLAAITSRGDGERLTTNQGLGIVDDQNTLKVGDRGPALLEDFLLREKITHFDHERIPERVVHARGAAAHGYFQVYADQAALTKAAFLQDPAVCTPVFVRFSTVAGSRGSSDLARDVRGFAVKFYTTEGNYDLVGNNMPVFFIQDAIKFPDLVHAVKPEPHNEIPQAASAHDTFWDFISLMPEAMHMVLWVMSDRGIPRSLRMMEGFGVHSFRLVTADGTSSFVKFHWKPLLGVHSLIWPEALQVSGHDPDFHRRDLWEAINDGAFPEWELGVQVVPEADEHRFAFDLLDATKLIPEELVPVQRIGKMTLNRNVDNYFAETEQVAFHAGHVVPGIDFSDDPLLAGRLFSYTDTQLLRLGGPNFHQIPINRPLASAHNHQRDGLHRQTIDAGRVAYSPNTLGGGCPMQVPSAAGGFSTHAATVTGDKRRRRGPKFFDHYSQAAMFLNSLADWEQAHLVAALQFELGKVVTAAVVERMLGQLQQVQPALAQRVSIGLGIPVPASIELPLNRSVPEDADPAAFASVPVDSSLPPSPALSMARRQPGGIATRCIAILAANGVDAGSVHAMQDALLAAGARSKIVAPHGGALHCADGSSMRIDHSLLTTRSVMFDAVFVAGGTDSVAELARHSGARHFVHEAYWHFKTIAAVAEGCSLVDAADVGETLPDGSGADLGMLLLREGAVAPMIDGFIGAIGRHRHWERERAALRRG